MKKTKEFPDIRRRAMMLGALGFAGISLLAGRLYYLQHHRAEKYRDLAEGNRVNFKIIPPIRGKILDREGRPLASNTNVFRLFIDLKQYRKPLDAIDALSPYISFSDAEREAARNLQKKRRYGNVFLIKDKVPWKEVVQVEHHMMDLPGISIEQGQQRFYPLSEQAAHCIGYVGAVNEEEQKRFYRWPQAKAGRQGLEKSLETRLRGEPGIQQLEVNARGVSLRKLDKTPAIKGENLHTSLHAVLQAYCYEELLKQQSGSAVIMHATSGEVLALASAPSFDSTVMSQGIGREDWDALRSSVKTPLMDKSIAGQYPPGSTFKMVTGLAGLVAGAINPQRRIFCPGHFVLGRRRFNCWKVGGHGRMNIVEALTQSCDTFFYQIANEIGIDALAETGKRLGLGSVTGLDIGGEKSGLMPTPEWKQQSYQQRWQGGDTINASIGQGYVLTTPLQLARMTAALVNGGQLLRPRLIQEAQSERIGFDPAWLSVIRSGMEAVVNGGRGTARGSRIDDDSYLMGGKTGTAQVKRIEIRGQNQAELPWHHRHHALFVGYAPIETPRYICAVVVEHGGGGSAVAAPLARDLLLKTRELVG